MKRRLYISTKTIETDKPSGGGHGPSVPYILSISIDGHPALHLTASQFKYTGQMAAFTEILSAISARDISESQA